jgi:WD40 repeat protein/MoxR-like ATPase
VTASEDETARVWDAQTGQMLKELTGHTSWINSASFSSDGKYIVTAGEDETARVWDAQTGQMLKELTGHTSWINSASFSSDGKYIVTASDDKTARVWDAQTGQMFKELTGHTGSITSASFSSDGKYIVTASFDITTRVWDAQTGQMLKELTGHTASVRFASFSSNGKYIVTASQDETALVWDAQTGRILKELTGHKGWVNSASFSSNGKYIVTAGMDETARVWDVSDLVAPAVQTGPAPLSLTGHTETIIDQTVAPDGTFAVTVSKDKTAKVWDTKTGNELMTLNPANLDYFSSDRLANDVQNVVVSPGSNHIAMSLKEINRDPRTTQGLIIVWDKKTGQGLPLESTSGWVVDMVFTPNGQYVIGLVTQGGQNSWLSAWDIRTGKRIGRNVELIGRGESLKISADGRSLIVDQRTDSTEDSISYVLEVKNGFEIQEPRDDDSARGWPIAISRNHVGAQFRAWVKRDFSIEVENMTTGKVIHRFKNLNNRPIISIDISSDGMRVLTVQDDSMARVWDVFSGTSREVFTSGYGFLKKAVFSQSGQYIIATEYVPPSSSSHQPFQSQVIELLWSAETGYEVPVFNGKTEAFEKITVSDDETFIVTHTVGETTAKVWEFRAEKQKAAETARPTFNIGLYPIDRSELGEEHPAPLTGDDLLVEIPETVAVENSALEGMRDRKIIILEGDPGGGKTDIALDIANRLGLRSFLYSAYARSHLRDFLGMLTKDENGRMVLTGKPDAQGRFKVPFLDMYTHGGVFIIDEGAIGRQSQALISWLTGFARGEQQLVIHHPGEEPLVLKRHKHFHIIITTNPEEETPARERVPPEIMSRSQRILVNNALPKSSLARIAKLFFDRTIKEYEMEGIFSETVIDDLVNQMVDQHQQTIRFIQNDADLDNPERHIITMRDMRNWVKAMLMRVKNGERPEPAFHASFNLIYASQFNLTIQNSPALGSAALRYSWVSNPTSRAKFAELGRIIRSEEEVKYQLNDVFALGLHGLLLLEPGSRDQKILHDFSREQGYRSYDFEANPQQTELDLIGGLFPFLQGENSPQGKEFGEKSGFLTRHLVPEKDRDIPGEKKLLVIHNIDALPERIRAVLNNFLLKGYIERRDDNGRMQRFYLPANTKIVATLSYLSQRDFSSAFFNRFVKLHVSAMQVRNEGFSELMQVLMFEQGLGEQEARQVQMIYIYLRALEDDGHFWPSGKHYNFTIKEAVLLGQFVKLAQQERPGEDIKRLIIEEALRLYGNRVREHDTDYANFKETVLKTLFTHDLVEELSGRVDYKDSEIAALSGVPLISQGKSWAEIDARYRLTLVPAITKTMSSILRGWQSGKVVSIAGETGAAKTTMGVFLAQLLFGRDDAESHYYIYSTHGQSKVSDLGLQLKVTTEGQFKMEVQEFLKRVQRGNQVIIIDEANMRPEILWALNGLARGDKEITVEVPGDKPYTVKVGENVFVMMTMNPESYKERGEIPEVLDENTFKLWAPVNYDNAEFTAILSDLAKAAEQRVLNRDLLRQAQVSLAGAAEKVTLDQLLQAIKEQGQAALRNFTPDELRELEQDILDMPGVKPKMDTIRTKAAITGQKVTIVFSILHWWAQSADGKFITVPLYELANPERSPEAVVGLIIHEFRHKLHSTTDQERVSLAAELGPEQKAKEAETIFHLLWNIIEDLRIDMMEDYAKAGEFQYVQWMNRELFGKSMSAEAKAAMIKAAQENPHAVLRSALLHFGYASYYRGRDTDPRYQWEPFWDFFDQLPKELQDAIHQLTDGGENSPLYRATRAQKAIVDFIGIQEAVKNGHAEKLRAAKESLKVILDEIYPVYKELYLKSKEYERSQQPPSGKPQSGKPGESGEQGEPGQAGEDAPGQGVPEFSNLTPEQLIELLQNISPQALPEGTTPQSIAVTLGISLPSGVNQQTGLPQLQEPGQDPATPQPKFLTDEERDALTNGLDNKIKQGKAARQQQMRTNEPLNLLMSQISQYGKKLAKGFIQIFRVPEEPDMEESSSGWVVNVTRWLTGNSEPFDQEVETLGKPNLAIGVTVDVTGSMDTYFDEIKKTLAILMSSFEQIGKKKAEYSISFFNTEFDDGIKPFKEKLLLDSLNKKFEEIVDFMSQGGRPGKGSGGATSIYAAVSGIVEKHKQIRKVNKIELVLTDGDDNMGDMQNGQASQRLKDKLAEAKKLGIEIIAIGFQGDNTDNIRIFDKYIKIDANKPEAVVEALLKIAKAKVRHGSLPLGDLGQKLSFRALRATESVQKVMASDSARGTNSPAEKVSSQIISKVPGGIDLNPANFELRIKRDLQGVPVSMEQQPPEIQNFKLDGLVPVIINITPVVNFPLLLGMAESDESQVASTR